MFETMNDASTQRDLEHLMKLKEKKRSRTAVDCLLGKDPARKELAEQLLADKPESASKADG